MTYWESLEGRRLMSATAVTPATLAADQAALSAAKTAQVVSLSADQQKLSADQSSLQHRMADAQLTFRADTSAFAQTFADDHAALLLKLNADRSVLSADMAIADGTHSADARAAVAAAKAQLHADIHGSTLAAARHRAQAKSTLAQDKSAIVAVRTQSISSRMTDQALLARHQVAARLAIRVAQQKLAADTKSVDANK